MKTDYPKLREYLKELRHQPEQEAFAKSCGTSLSYLRKAMSKGAKMDVKLVECIVEKSGFRVPPEELRPDIDWGVFAMQHVAKAIPGPAKVRTLRPRRTDRPTSAQHGVTSDTPVAAAMG